MPPLVFCSHLIWEEAIRFMAEHLIRSFYAFLLYFSLLAIRFVEHADVS